MNNHQIEETLGSINAIRLTGNTLPHVWFSKITLDSGAADLLGILLLSEIVAWYQSQIIRNKHRTPRDALQKQTSIPLLKRSTQSFAEQFHVNSRHVDVTLKRLIDKGFIIRESQDVRTSSGTIKNVMRLIPVAHNIAQLQSGSYQPSNDAFMVPEFSHHSHSDDTQPQLHHGTIMPFIQSTLKEALTPSQKAEVKQAVAHLASLGYLLNPKQIEREIEFALLSPNTMNRLHPFFERKLSLILSLIKENRWGTPFGMMKRQEHHLQASNEQQSIAVS